MSPSTHNAFRLHDLEHYVDRIDKRLNVSHNNLDGRSDVSANNCDCKEFSVLRRTSIEAPAGALYPQRQQAPSPIPLKPVLSRITNRRVSVKDVALAAGVSTQTVSRVVNDAASVAPATREKVAEVIRQLGYRRSELARGLNQGRTWTLGVVFSGHDSRGGIPMNRGVTAEAEAMGYSLVLKEGLDKSDANTGTTDVDWVRSLLARQVDGILWMVAEDALAQRAVLEQVMHDHGVPVVGLSTSPGKSFPIVSFDNHAAGMLATQHLISQGRRMIVHIAGRGASWDARGRQDGWRDALLMAGLPAEPNQVVAGDWSPASGDRALRQLLQQCPTLDAVFAGNDSMALGVLHAAHELGVSVPKQLAVVGVDDIPGAAYYIPALTTISQSLPDLGRRAVRMLAALAEARFNGIDIRNAQSYLQAPELHVRASSL